MAKGQNRPQATLVGGKHSHHYAIPAPLLLLQAKRCLIEILVRLLTLGQNMLTAVSVVSL